MSVPSSRLGEEVGWTTVYYYSAHDDIRRDIWRYQWRMRMKIDDGKRARRLDSERQRQLDKERRHVEHEDEMWKRIDQEKWKLDIPKERRQRRKDLLEVYNKELEDIKAEKIEEKQREKERLRIEFHRMQSVVRENRRKKRQEERQELHLARSEDDEFSGVGRAYRSSSRDFELNKIRNNIERRRREQSERIEARKLERGEETNSYRRYLKQEDEWKAKVKNIDSELEQKRNARRDRLERDIEKPQQSEARRARVVPRFVPPIEGIVEISEGLAFSGRLSHEPQNSELQFTPQNSQLPIETPVPLPDQISPATIAAPADLVSVPDSPAVLESSNPSDPVQMESSLSSTEPITPMDQSHADSNLPDHSDSNSAQSTTEDSYDHEISSDEVSTNAGSHVTLSDDGIDNSD